MYRAGENLGRIYRAYRSDFTPYAAYDWSKADDDRLIAALQSPSSAIADVARQQLIWGSKKKAINPTGANTVLDRLRRLISQSDQAIVRLRALATLNALGQCKTDDWFAACKDIDSRVVRWAVENMTKQGKVGGEERLAVIAAAQSELARQSPALALQLIASLSLCSEPASAEVGKLLSHHAGDPWIDGAIAFLTKDGIDTCDRTIVGDTQAFETDLCWTNSFREVRRN